MNKFESVIILRADLSASKVNEIVSEIYNKIKEYSKSIEKQDLGIKKLAYEVKQNSEGHYFIYQFKLKDNLDSSVISEIEKYYRIKDEILKFIIVKCE